MSDLLREQLLRVAENALAIPFYAYGDNEAACRMADALKEIREGLAAAAPPAALCGLNDWRKCALASCKQQERCTAPPPAPHGQGLPVCACRWDETGDHITEQNPACPVHAPPPAAPHTTLGPEINEVLSRRMSDLYEGPAAPQPATDRPLIRSVTDSHGMKHVPPPGYAFVDLAAPQTPAEPIATIGRGESGGMSMHWHGPALKPGETVQVYTAPHSAGPAPGSVAPTLSGSGESSSPSVGSSVADRKDAERYRFLRARLLALDSQYGERRDNVLVFLWPDSARVSMNLDASIDAAMGSGCVSERRWRKVTCACVNVPMGSYANQVRLTYPFDGKPIGIDRCVADEIQALWARGIRTTGHCCGHNVAPPYIGVEYESITNMLRLGYEIHPNFSRPGDEDSFYPKSVRYALWRRLWRRVCVWLMAAARDADRGWAR